MWVRWVSQVRAALGPTSLLSHLGHRGKNRTVDGCVSSAFGYGVTPRIADGVDGAARSPASPDVGIVILALGEDGPDHPRMFVGLGVTS